MPKLILLSALLFLSPSSYAESWFDSAQEFFGFGGDETTEAPARLHQNPLPLRSPTPRSKP